MLTDKTPTSQQSSTVPANGRVELLAAIWARQTGRSIVISPGTYPGRARGT